MALAYSINSYFHDFVFVFVSSWQIQNEKAHQGNLLGEVRGGGRVTVWPWPTFSYIGAAVYYSLPLPLDQRVRWEKQQFWITSWKYQTYLRAWGRDCQITKEARGGGLLNYQISPFLKGSISYLLLVANHCQMPMKSLLDRVIWTKSCHKSSLHCMHWMWVG